MNDFDTITNTPAPFVKYQPDAHGRRHMHGMTPGAMCLVRLAVWWSRCTVAFDNWRFDRRYRIRRETRK